MNLIPMGTFALADSLSTAGFHVEIIHELVERIMDRSFDYAEFIARRQFDIVCLPLHWHYQSAGVIEAARKIKERSPRVRILTGGYTASLFATELMQSEPEIDFVIRGEADRPIIQLVKALELATESEAALTAVPNLVWRNPTGAMIENPHSFCAGQEEIDGLDYANLSLLRHFDVYLRLPEHSIRLDEPFLLKDETKFIVATGRGCPFECFYCGGGRQSQRQITARAGYMFRSRETVIREIRRLVALGVQHIVFDFDPEPSGQYYVNLFTSLRSLSLPLRCTWVAWGLPNPEVVRSLLQSGFSSVELVISPDFGSETVRRRNKSRHFSNFDLMGLLDELDDEQASGETRLRVVLYFFVGGPGETDATIEQTVQLIARIREHRCVRAVLAQVPQLEPASPLSSMDGQDGISVKRRSFADYCALSREISRQGGDVDCETLMGFSLGAVSPDSLRAGLAKINTGAEVAVVPTGLSDALKSLEEHFIPSPDYESHHYVQCVGCKAWIPAGALVHTDSQQEFALTGFESLVYSMIDGHKSTIEVYRILEQTLAPVPGDALLKAYFQTLKRLLLNGAVQSRKERHAAS